MKKSVVKGTTRKVLEHMNEKFLEQLLSEISVSGYEEPIQDVVEAQMRDCADEIRRDEMSNLICVVNPEAKRRIMLSAHADEIGLMISNITEDGRIQVIARGGIILATYLGQQVQIKTAQGNIPGVVETCRELTKKSDLKTSDIRIDIGAEDKEEALRYVSLGDPIVLDTKIHRMANGRLTARALDDRVGVFIIMEALRKAKAEGCKVGVYAASTVGEETTMSGAYWTSTRIQPDLAIVVDVTYTSDYAGTNAADFGTVKLGGGPVLCNSPMVVKKLNEEMKACAKKVGIEVQMEAASRMTYNDGDKIHFSNQGVPMVLVSIPLRYMHTPAEMADLKDVQDCIDLIAEFLVEQSR